MPKLGQSWLPVFWQRWAIIRWWRQKSPKPLPIIASLQRKGDVYKRQGVERIPAVGEPFDPKWHEAIGQVPVEAEEQVDTVVEEIRPGYKIGDKLIRVAMVRVGTKA